MQVFSGHSLATDVDTAIDEACQWHKEGNTYSIVFVLYSSDLDGNKLVNALKSQLGAKLIAGCTTAGEHLNGKHLNEALTVTALITPETDWAVDCVPDLDRYSASKLDSHCQNLLNKLGMKKQELSPDRNFVMNFIDGLAGKEECFVSTMIEAFEGIPCIGGSAGDNLKFQKTFVLTQDGAHNNAAVLVLARTKGYFALLKHQHFVSKPIDLVITAADEAARKVKEIDGLPARQRYAELVGCAVEDLSPDVFSLYPLIFETDGERYVRSVQTANDDDTLTFYCAIETGMVLSIGDHLSMTGELRKDLKKIEGSFEEVDFIFTFNCILRSLESLACSNHDELGRSIKAISSSLTGFDTYGEQFNGLHINQTLVGLVMGKKSA